MPDRAPVMVPSPQARRGLAVVRGRRVLVEAGALVLVHEGGRREVLAAPGEVTAAWWTPVDTAAGLPRERLTAHGSVQDAVVLERRDAAPLVLRLGQWLPAAARAPYDLTHGVHVAGLPGPPEDPSLSAAVRVSGAAAVVAALGLQLRGAAGRQRLEELRAVLVAGRFEVTGLVGIPRPVALSLAVPAGLALALVYGVVLTLIDGEDAYGVVVAAGMLASVTVAVRTALQVRGSLLLRAAEPPGAVLRPRPVVPTSRRFVERALLAVGPDWLVTRDQHGREGWTPGPAQGGAVVVRVAWPWLGVHDADDARLWIVRLDEWTSREALDGWLQPWRDAGFAVLQDALPGPTEQVWRGVPTVDGNEPTGLPGTWSLGAFALCALSLALQVRVLSDRLDAEDLGASWAGAVPPGLAVVVGLVLAVRQRRESAGLTQAATLRVPSRP